MNPPSQHAGHDVADRTLAVPVAVRAYAETQTETPPDGRRRRKRRSADWEIPELVHVLDTETRTDHRQALTFGCARTYDREGRCTDEVLFHADDLPQEELAALAAYVRAHNRTHRHEQIRLLPRRQYLKQVFRRVALQGRGLVVGFNLPFDLSRLGVGWGRSRSSGFAGGFSLILFDYEKDGVRRENRYRPRVVLKSIDSKRALKGLSSCREPEAYDQLASDAGDGHEEPKKRTFRGHFLDLRTLAFALTNTSYSLSNACQDFGVAHGKLSVEEHGRVTAEYVDYNRRDVLATWELYVKLREEHARHPIALPMPQAYSPASLGKAYLEAMGIRPPLERQPDFPKDVLGHAMAAYYGGRAECRIRAMPVPVVYLDFLSMYPTVCRLLDLWALLTCERVEVVDATDEVRELLADVTVDACFRPETWRKLVGLVQLAPEGDILPTRARYGGEAGWQIGVNRLSSPSEPLWYTIPDAVASTLLGGKPPRVLRALRLVPRGTAPDLRPIVLRGAIAVDPSERDFFQLVIEERKRVDQRKDLPPEERTRLSTLLKVLANSTSYGIYAQMDRRELPKGEKATVAVHGNGDRPFATRVAAPEEPGPYCFPPIAACIAGAARLMLALLEHAVTDAGGAYAMCDTDSMAIVATEDGGLVPCPGGPHRMPGRKKREAIRALSWAEVEAIRDRFAALNPYDREAIPGSVLKLEQENLGEDGRQRQLWCYAISAKRYALYTLDEAGRPRLVKYSEHGLGHLLDPTDPDGSDGSWMATLWEGMITEAVGLPYAWPKWLDRSAVGRITASSPELLRPFAALNKGKPYAAQVKPFNFLLAAFVAPLGHPPSVDPARFHLVAPFEADPRKWTRMRWTDLYSARSYRIATEASPYATDTVCIKTYRHVLAEYRTHPETKSAGADGSRPCARGTAGLLGRLHVRPAAIAHVGKEANKLEEVQAGLVHDPGEVYTEYRDPAGHDPEWEAVVAVLKHIPRRHLMERTGLSRTAITAIRNHRARPRLTTGRLLTRIARDHAVVTDSDKVRTG